jgi:hypothetical protein
MPFDLEKLEDKLRLSSIIKKKLGFFAGLKWAKTNTGGYAFSRHWPHIIPFSWTIWFELQPAFKYKKENGKSWPTYFFQFIKYPKINKAQNTYWLLQFLWFFRISFHTQDQDWMIIEHPRFVNLFIPKDIKKELFFDVGDEEYITFGDLAI